MPQVPERNPDVVIPIIWAVRIVKSFFDIFAKVDFAMVKICLRSRLIVNILCHRSPHDPQLHAYITILTQARAEYGNECALGRI